MSVHFGPDIAATAAVNTMPLTVRGLADNTSIKSRQWSLHRCCSGRNMLTLTTSVNLCDWLYQGDLTICEIGCDMLTRVGGKHGSLAKPGVVGTIVVWPYHRKLETR